MGQTATGPPTHRPATPPGFGRLSQGTGGDWGGLWVAPLAWVEATQHHPGVTMLAP
jgi:hypothetical protein